MIENIQNSNIITAYSGDLEIIGNGIAPCTTDMPLKIKIKDLELVFKFESDSTKEMKAERRVDGKKLILVLLNFNNSLGSGIIEPVEFGIIDHKKVYLSYWVWTPSSKDSKRIINWTILQGEEISKSEE
jgi:hypothetical protein